MNIAVQQVLRAPAQHFADGAVDERCIAIGVDAVDALACRVQYQVVTGHFIQVDE